MTSRSSAVAFDSEDSVRPYLSRIGKVPLLTAAGEVDLAVKIQAGVEAEHRLERADADRSPLVRRRLERVAAVGVAARETLTVSNLRLVVMNAKRYQGLGLPLADLIQAGNIGLMRAVEKYDHTRGFRFSTYATNWIKQGIRRAISDQARNVRLPVHMGEQIQQVNRVRRGLVTTLGREPRNEEIAAELEVDVERVEMLLSLSHDTISLETPVGTEGDCSLGEFVVDDKEPTAFDSAVVQAMRDDVAHVLSTLTDRERRVIELRFGLGDDAPCTLDEVGREFGVTRERIRQIEGKTLSRLRSSSHVARMREYIN
ncbi:MAG: sigma-70 family RNA polymerase sigma factor [Coriobacteriia bacterium]|nr:sigma-70 family RNA polymerase sigma factor [Coriobacteriia bacterium]